MCVRSPPLAQLAKVKDESAAAIAAAKLREKLRAKAEAERWRQESLKHTSEFEKGTAPCALCGQFKGLQAKHKELMAK